MKLSYESYQKSIEHIIDYLDHAPKADSTKTMQIQSTLDSLAERYQNDDELGWERYKMAHAQALLFQLQGKDVLALKWVREAVAIRGFEYQGAKNIKLKINNLPSKDENLVTPMSLPKVKAAENTKTSKSKENFWSQIGSVLGVLVSYAIGRTLGLTYFLLIIPLVLGLFIGSKFSHKMSPILLKFIVWTNLISWFVPVLGVFVATFTFTLKEDERLTRWRQKLEILITNGLILSISNGVFGAINKLHGRTGTDDLVIIMAHVFLFALAILLGWLSIRIQITTMKRSIVKKIGLWSVSLILVICGYALGSGVIEAFIINHTHASSAKASKVDPTTYWASFTVSCKNEALKGEGITSDAAGSYCGCMVSKLSAEFTPEEAEAQSQDPASKYSSSFNGNKTLCAEQAGLVVQ